MKIIALDLETTTRGEVYSWCWTKDGKKYHDGICITTLFKSLEQLKDDYVIFSHNGAKFDNHFILKNLKSCGYTQQAFKENRKVLMHLEKNTYKENNTEPTGDLDRREYKLFATGNTIYEIQIGGAWYKKRLKRPRHNTIKFRDSALLFPNTLAGYGKALNKFHGTEEFTKLQLEGGYNRSEKYESLKEFYNDGNEREYLHIDVKILWFFLDMMDKVLPKKKWEITSGSTSYKEWIRIFGDKMIKSFYEKGILERKVTDRSTIKNPHYWYREKGKKKWRSTTKIAAIIIERMLPVKWLDHNHPQTNEINSQMLYRWYGGGMTHSNPKYMGVVLKDLLKTMVDDINSSYSSSMNSKFDMPYGTPVFKRKKGYDFELMRIIATKSMKNKNGFPFLSRFTGDSLEYISHVKKGQVFYVNSHEWIRVKKYYGKDWSVKVEYAFRTIKGSKLFGDYVDKYYELKAQGKKDDDPAIQSIVKLFLNALYGKFATKTLITSKIWNHEEDKWEKEEYISNAKFYFPLGLTITSLARMKIVDAVDTNYEWFIYCDTDSIFYIQEMEHVFKHVKHPTELGAWDTEMRDGTGIVRRKKQYFFNYPEEKNGNIKMKTKDAFAGANFNRTRKPTPKEFIAGGIIENQLRRVDTNNGIILENYEKELKPIWDYNLPKDCWFQDRASYFKNISSYTDKLKKEVQNAKY